MSGKQAIKYRSADLEISLSSDELLRLLAHDLWPDEYFGLVRHFGEFHEINEDFYDPETGAARQFYRVPAVTTSFWEVTGTTRSTAAWAMTGSSADVATTR